MPESAVEAAAVRWRQREAAAAAEATVADAAKDAAVAEAGSSRRHPVGVLTDPLETQPTCITRTQLLSGSGSPSALCHMFAEVDIVVEEADKEAERVGEGPR